MSDESPPPYSAITTSILLKPPVFATESPEPETGLPFENSDNLAAKVLALVSEGKTLDSRFKEVRDVASAGAQFDYQERALVLCRRFEGLVWESRNVASIALVAIKDFNEVILDFLSEPDVAAQDRLKELSNASKLLQPERESATSQKSAFEALIGGLEEFHRTIHSESGIPNLKRRRRSDSGSRGDNDPQPSRKPFLPISVPFSKPLSGFTAPPSLGVISRTVVDYAKQFERAAEQAIFPWCVGLPPEAPAQVKRDASPAPVPAPTLPERERKRLSPPDERAETVALPSLVDTLLHDLRAFASRIDVFETVFAELARAQDVFVVYLKDGQSIANQAYRSEISRLRRHLHRVCNALDAYSKARLS